MKKWTILLLLAVLGTIMCQKGIHERRYDEHELVREKNGAQLGCILCEYFKDQSAAALDLLDQNFNAVLHLVCFKVPYPYQACIAVAKTWEPVIFKSYMRAVINRKDLICGLIFQVCDSPDLSFVDVRGYVKNILADKPAIKPRPKPTMKKTYTILSMNDPHIDMKYDTEGAFNCHNDIVCCRKGAVPKVGETKIKSGPFGMRGPCDLPMRTYEDFLKFAKETINPDMMFWLGDNEVHELDKISKEGNLNTTKYVADKMKEVMKDTPIFLSIGNHESFPVDQYDQMASDTAWMLPGLAQAYGDIIPQKSLDQIAQRGFYSQRIPERNLKIISLFGQLYDSMNFYLIMRTFDPLGHLQWLQRELEASEHLDEDVYIIMHIPPGTSFTIAKWNDIFNALMERYANTVISLFSGHTHEDHILFHTESEDKTKVFTQNFCGASLTTYSAYHPSFRVFKIDEDTNQILDYDQYRLDLDKWNKVTDPKAHATWDKVYSFKDYYNVSAIDRKGMQEFRDRLASGDDDTLKTYKTAMPPYKRPETISQSEKNMIFCDIKDNTRDVKMCYEKFGFKPGLDLMLGVDIDFYLKVN